MANAFPAIFIANGVAYHVSAHGTKPRISGGLETEIRIVAPLRARDHNVMYATGTWHYVSPADLYETGTVKVARFGCIVESTAKKRIEFRKMLVNQ